MTLIETKLNIGNLPKNVVNGMVDSTNYLLTKYLLTLM